MQPAYDHAPPQPPQYAPLPAGWSEAQDPATGNTYYYNQVLTTTQLHLKRDHNRYMYKLMTYDDL